MRSIFATSTLNKSDDGLPKALGGLPGPARETPSPTSCGSPPLPCETPRVLAATCFNTTRDVTPGTRAARRSSFACICLPLTLG